MTNTYEAPRAGHSATGQAVSVDNGHRELNAQTCTWQRIGEVLARMGFTFEVAS
ncbi:hypothetical protein [Ruegeria sp. HKCCA5491]|uniref:hypothetical protein n=1 Tax=Ruegeria sp. HKCCA5491 TaxID=2682986 RepID=UPI001487FB9C|nr:hypothetical protein [Ruegeria sp. HKCCA5491]